MVNEDRARAVAANADEPIVVLDSERRVVAASNAAESLLGAVEQGRRLPEELAAAHPDVLVLFLESPPELPAYQELRAGFTAAVSHELRTPLAQIRLFAETLLLDRIRTPEERRRSLEIIDQEARRLTQLVENTLQFSRAERGAAALDREPQDVARLVRLTVESFAPLAGARQARLTAEVPETLTAAVDEGAFRQILLNLLDNAVKYGPAGQEVRVTLTSESNQVRLAVEDEGPGIPERDRERVWQRFVRLDRDRETPAAGAGIGLSVVRDLVSLHSGRAWIEEGATGGCRFVVSIPLGVGK